MCEPLVDRMSFHWRLSARGLQPSLHTVLLAFLYCGGRLTGFTRMVKGITWQRPWVRLRHFWQLLAMGLLSCIFLLSDGLFALTKCSSRLGPAGIAVSFAMTGWFSPLIYNSPLSLGTCTTEICVSLFLWSLFWIRDEVRSIDGNADMVR